MDSPIKAFGGKSYLAEKYVSYYPRARYVHWVETHCYTAAFTLAHFGHGKSEVINDINSNCTNFWRVLADPLTRKEFIERLQFLPFSQEEFGAAQYRLAKLIREDDEIGCAVDFFTVCRQSLMGIGEDFAPLSRTRVRRLMNEQVSAYLSAIDRLPEVSERLRRVVVMNMDAVDLIKREDGPHTAFICDPPYLKETRQATDVYEFEYTPEDHEKLLDTIIKCKGMVGICGYDSEMYNDKLRGWTKRVHKIDNKASTKDLKETKAEIFWTNFQ